MAPLIKAKNLLHLDDASRTQVWDALRGLTDVRVKLRDLMPVPLIGNFSVGVHGVLVALIGDDPNPTGI